MVGSDISTLGLRVSRVFNELLRGQKPNASTEWKAAVSAAEFVLSKDEDELKIDHAQAFILLLILYGLLGIGLN